MASSRFYLEKRRNSSGDIRSENVPIYFYFSFNGKRFQHFTGERISFADWDDKRQRAKASHSGSLELNHFLELLNEKAFRIYRECRLQNFIPTVEQFKVKFNDLPKGHSKTFFDHFSDFMQSKKNHGTESSLKKYRTIQTHLRDFSRIKRYKLEFDSIDEEFFNKLLDYFIYDCGHTNNTINRTVITFKTFLNWCTRQGVNKNYDYKNFFFKGYDGEVVHLTYEELMHLYRMDISNERLDRVRDAFCFGCFSGLRYSDIKNLKKENIQHGYIRSYSVKTKDQLSVPINDFMAEILSKYQDYPTNYCIPVLSNQKMNDYLKELGKLAELFSPINIVRFRGSERIEEVHLKYELLSTHVARKTFVTIAYQKGMPAETIMKITNHKSHETLKRYLKIGDELKKKAMNNIF